MTKTKGKPRKKVYSWIQPCCVRCWVDIKVKIGRASKATGVAFCVFCRNEIGEADPRYDIRVNPNAVPYPTVEKEPEE